jgi:hypothetical protein
MDECRFAGAQVTLQTDHIAWLQGCAQTLPEAAGLFRTAAEKIDCWDFEILHLKDYIRRF